MPIFLKVSNILPVTGGVMFQKNTFVKGLFVINVANKKKALKCLKVESLQDK